RMANITTSDVRAYVARRQEQGIANGTVNREVSALKRMFSLLVQAGRLVARPYIPLLKEAPPRAGFFEHAPFLVVRRHLPAEVRGLVTFAYITGWRIKSEVQALQWRQVDLVNGAVRLDPGQAKSGDPRIFPLTAELREVLTTQREYVTAQERRLRRVIPHV